MNISRNVLLAALVTLGFPVVAGETPAATTEVTAPTTTPAATTEVKKEEGKGFFGTIKSGVYSAFYSPITLTDWVASKAGAESLANWLGSASKDKEGKELEKGAITSFFANHKDAFKRLFAVTETAVVVAAAYKAYQTFIAEEDTTDEEYVDVFGDEEEMMSEEN